MQPDFPDVIRIESSGACNFKCRHCPTSYRKVKRGLLTRELFSLLLEQFARKNFIPRVAVLYHGGEPLLNKNLPEMLAELKKIGVQKTVITTNISLMTAEIAQKLSTGILDELKVSFDGNSPSENDEIRVNGNFAEDHKKLLYFLSINDKTCVKVSNVRVCNTVNDISASLPPPIYLTEIFEKFNNIGFQSFPAMVWPGLKTESSPYKAYEQIKKDTFHCSAFKETITVLSNGDVVPCCYDLLGDAVLGNIQDDDIFEIRNNLKSKMFFKAISEQRNIPKICQNCIVHSGAYLVQQS